MKNNIIKAITKFLDMVSSGIISDAIAELTDNVRNNKYKYKNTKSEKISSRANAKAQKRSKFKTHKSKHKKMIKFKLKFGPLKVQLIIK